MNKTVRTTVGGKERLIGVAVLLSAILMLGCSSPAEKANKYYERGMELMAKGDMTKARIELQNALQIQNDMTKAWYAMAQVAELQGDWERLFGLLNKVVDLDPKHVEAQLKLGRLMLAAGQLDRALKISDLTLDLDRNNASVLALRAAVLFKLDDKAGAIEQANASLAIDPKNVDAVAVLATERLSAGDAEKAIEYLDRALVSNEKNIALQLIKVQALEKLSKLDNAEEIFRKLIALYPETPAFRNVLAQFYIGHRRFDKAEAEFRAIANDSPKNVNARMEVVRFVGQLRGQKAAIDELNGFIAKDPEDNELKFALASVYQAQRDLKSAEAMLRTLIGKLGDTPDGLKAKGQLAAMSLASNDKKAAMVLVDEILAKDQRNEQGLLLKASVSIDDRNLDSAIADLRTILKDAPNSARALTLLGKAHELSGSSELAQEQYQKAFQASKYAPQYGLSYAEFLLRKGQASRAASVVEDVLKGFPDNIAAKRMLAQARINQRDWVGAQAVADELRKAGAQQVSDQIAGTVQLAKRNYAESISSFKRAYETSPAEVQPMVALVRTYLVAGKINEASNFLSSVVKSAPTNVNALLLQGQVATVKGDTASAIQAFKRAIELQSVNPAGYAGLAETYMRAKKHEDAQKAIDAGLAAVPNDFGLKLAQAGAHEMAGRIDDAIKAYEQILKERPNADVVANNLASLLSDHRTDKASLVRAHDLAQRFKTSQFPQFKDTLGWVNYKLGRQDEALSLIQDASKQMPDLPVFRYHLGMTYMAKNNKGAAKKEFEKALELAKGKDFMEAEAVRTALKGL